MANPLTNEIRPGTSGIGGHLYESNLLGLLLHRVHRDNEIDKFYLGTNIKDLGAFDDIVFKYYLKNDKRPKIFFVQAKHKDNSTKELLTMNTLLKPYDSKKNIFGLDNYYEGCEKIKHKLKQKCENHMFEDDINNVDYSFIIYTPLFENFKEEQKKKLCSSGKETLLITNNDFIPFILNFDESDKHSLLQNILMKKVTAVAESFADKIESGNYKNMMMSELIRIYHVYLAHNVVEITSKSDDHLLGKFRISFLDSEDNINVRIKTTIFKKLKIQDSLSVDSSQINKTFKLPLTFGNLEIPNSEEFNDVCKLIKKLMSNKDKQNIIRIDDEMIGRYKIINKKEMASLGKFVGQMLFLNITTGFYKFRLYNEKSHKMLVEMLKKENITKTDITSTEFDINYQFFPQDRLCNRIQEMKNIDNFLSRIILYTNQAKEESVAQILKKEIEQCLLTEKTSNISTHFNVDAIYLKYHDSIQSWWKEPKEYLTNTCKFYEEAKNNILFWPLLDVLNYIYVAEMKNFNIQFNQEAIDSLGLQEFIHISDKRVYFIYSTDSVLTSIKTIQYLENKENMRLYQFVSLNIISQGYSEDIMNKISQSEEVKIVILVLNETWHKYTKEIIRYVNYFIEQSIKKVIIISPSSTLKENFNNIVNFVHVEDKINTIDDFTENAILRIITQKNILFQGNKVSLTSLYKNIRYLEYFGNIQGEVLNKIINNKTIKIGSEPTNIEGYRKTENLYVNRRVCRCVRLTGTQFNLDFVICDYNNYLTSSSGTKNDVIVICNSIEEINRTDAYEHANENKNIHFFYKRFGNILNWAKSYGRIQNLYPYIERCVSISCLPFEPQSMLDLNERVVIISAGPGSGKSTFVTHLMMQTKCFDESMCILKLDFLDLISELEMLKSCSSKLKFLLTVLYKSFSLLENEKPLSCFDSAIVDPDYKIKIVSEVDFNNQCNLDLFELKTFINLYNNRKILIIFDGFDEICPYYKKEALDLFKVLIPCRVRKLWITSRSNIVLNELECEMNTFSFALKDFSIDDQIIFLRNIAKSIDENDEKIQSNEIYHAMISISSKIDFKKEFTGTPLHLRMIANILKNEDINSDFFAAIRRQSLNITTLYKKFVDFIYYDIRFGEKKKGNECSKNPDLRNLIETERNRTMNGHKLLAAYSLLDKNILTKNELTFIDDFIKNINTGNEKTGIIESIYNKRDKNYESILPKFIHFTFAEYFSSEFICDRIEQCSFTEYGFEYFVDNVLSTGDGGTRWFIDSKISNEKNLLFNTSSVISNALIKQHASFKSSLDIALVESCFNIAEFLLNNIYKHIQQNELNDFITLITKNHLTCSICCEREKRKDISGKQNIKLLSLIINIIAENDVQSLSRLYFLPDGPNLDLFKHSLLCRDPLMGKDVTLKDMFKNMKPEDFVKLLNELSDFRTKETVLQSHLQIISRGNDSTDKLIFKDSLMKLNPEQSMLVFCNQNKRMRTSAHYAAFYQNFEFFDLMKQKIGNEGLRHICTQVDSYGFIPLRYFEFTKNYTAFENVLDRGDFFMQTYKPEICDSFINKLVLLCNKVDIHIVCDSGWHYLKDSSNPYFVW